jgi:MFS family permease
LLAVTGSGGWAPFIVVIIILLITAMGLFFIRFRLPEFTAGEKRSVRAFLPLAPVLLMAMGIFAFFEQAVLALLPIYGLHFGLTERVMAVGLGVMISGNVLMQYPIGWIADYLSRRSVLVGCAIMTVAGSLALPFAITKNVLLWPLLFLWGASAFGGYTVALAELGDRFSGSMLLAGNAAFAMMWGVGGLIGTPIAGGAMDLFGPNGLPASLGLFYFLLAAIAVRGQPSLKEMSIPTK